MCDRQCQTVVLAHFGFSLDTFFIFTVGSRGTLDRLLSHLGDSLEYPEAVGVEEEDDLVLDEAEEAEQQRADAGRHRSENVHIPRALGAYASSSGCVGQSY